jgi:candicidin polyketide synthase FscB
VEWIPVPVTPAESGPGWALAGPDLFGLTATRGLAATRAYPGLAALTASIEAGEPLPELVLACAGAPDFALVPDGDSGGEDVPATARRVAGQVLELVQAWLADERLASSRLVLVTRGAMAVGPDEGVTDLAGAAVWGLVRSAQAENPDRLVMIDLVRDGGTISPAVLAAGEPELAIRGETVYARRLSRPVGGRLAPSAGRPRRAGTGYRRAGRTGGGASGGYRAGAGRGAGQPVGAGRARRACAGRGPGRAGGQGPGGGL